LVPQDSSTGYIGSGPKINGSGPQTKAPRRIPYRATVTPDLATCTYDTDYLLAAKTGGSGLLGVVGALAGVLGNEILDSKAADRLLQSKASPFLAQLTAYAATTPCFHTNLTTLPKLANATITALATYATAASQQTPATDAYVRRRNARFGFSFDVPASFLSTGTAADGDGFGYRSPDRQAEVSAVGEINNLENNPDASTSVRQAYEKELATLRSAGDSITYQALVGNAITFSGITSNGEIYFTRIVWGPGSVNTLGWSYPRSQQGQLKGAVENSVATFQSGDLSSSH
jgi:hypothetical protein